MEVQRLTEPETQKPARKSGLLRSFGFAWSGLKYLIRNQRNARIEIIAAAIVCGLGAWLHIDQIQWTILILTIAMVLTLEGLNTALEAAVDLAMPHQHPLAKTCKDVAAGMVLIAALASVCVGILILGPPLWNRLVK